MKVVDRFKENFINKDFFISLYENNLYLLNYISINEFNDHCLCIEFEKFRLIIKGTNLRIISKSEKEIVINGVINIVELSYE